ncbi:alkene reductase [Clavibacter michiganensis]|uniref:alkene reductase n=1 Tax=Clavibacter michiganensis TaxID=28447 RepID=UPI000B36D16D|nr:alkene reductase [Clavibacter michiganensis]KAF0257629.1 N-ethylmaleimide reductase [Clavibacter michiganensis subsp. michiganensis]MDO4031620.1 alkene reductase [Clavibacter michiganensis]MDO4041739.1 alkene reductase [Clavibacter michiganensis]MDO4059567.1 alkene reductase [Clavibacter michiganensis]MDO4078143.1 alkene reductase [Clavibacter michiganensis]
MKLFSPVALGALELPNRVAMAPLTRMRSDEHGVPGDIVVEYYRQRASTGLIVSEGVFTSERSKAYPGQPGIVTDEQIAGWRRVTDAVHEAGGRIVMQLMHGGRVSHEEITGGLPLLAPSAIAIQGEVHTPTGKAPYPVPSEPETDEVPLIVDELTVAARNAVDAGFDGVEIHSANGYLLHEFLSPVSNVRTDAYGGSPENRAKLGIDVAHAVSREIGAERVGIRISPSHNIQDVLEEDADETRATYEALLSGIAPLGLAYVSILHAEPAGDLVQGLRKTFGGPLMINSGFGVQTERDEAIQLVEEGAADVVAVGRMVIANPDLVERWESGAETNEPNPATFYGPGAEGYTDYPALAS